MITGSGQVFGRGGQVSARALVVPDSHGGAVLLSVSAISAVEPLEARFAKLGAPQAFGELTVTVRF